MKLMFTLFFTLLVFASSAQSKYLTVSEKKLVNYMSKVVKLSASISGSHVYPWVVCHNLDSHEEEQSSIFLSSPMYYKNEQAPMYEMLIFGWMVKLINQAVEFSVTRGFCSYQIDHFEKCILQGAINVEISDGQIIKFEDVYYDDKCNHSSLDTRENLIQKYLH